VAPCDSINCFLLMLYDFLERERRTIKMNKKLNRHTPQPTTTYPGSCWGVVGSSGSSRQAKLWKKRCSRPARGAQRWLQNVRNHR
jgi:hypothetical protein